MAGGGGGKRRFADLCALATEGLHMLILGTHPLWPQPDGLYILTSLLFCVYSLLRVNICSLRAG